MAPTTECAEGVSPDIEELVLSDDEYTLWTAAAAAAENQIPAAVSVFLTASESALTSSPFLLTLRPRPRFPPPLFDALLTHGTNKAQPYEDLHFPLHLYPYVHDLVTACGLAFSMPPVIVSTAVYLSSLVKNSESKDAVIAALSPTVWPQLHSFQQSGVLRAICSLQGRVLFADDMGLGKTVQAVAVAEYYRRTHLGKKPPPVLIMCPATLREPWRDAVLRWIPDLESGSVHVVSSVRDFHRLAASHQRENRDPWDESARIEFVIVAYDLLCKITHFCLTSYAADDCAVNISGLCFPIVIADECHTLRNKDTARTKSALHFLVHANRRILISGTPVLSRPSELFPLLTALLTRPGVPFLSHEEYVQRYCGGDGAASRAVTYGDELNLLLCAVMIRRVKEDVQQSLPPKVRHHVVLDLPPLVLQPLMKLKIDHDELVEQIEQDANIGSNYADLQRRRKAFVAALIHKTAHAKIPGVVTRVQQLIRNINGPKKFLVFAHHLEILDAVEALAVRECTAYIRIDGQTASTQRSNEVAAFQNDPGVRIAILSLAVAGTGLTLTAADVVLFAELSWVPSELLQAEDRAHRLGRRGKVSVEYLIAPGTADDMMWSAVKSKLNLLNKTVDGSHERRKKTSDISALSGKRIHISEVAMQDVRMDAINALDSEMHDLDDVFAV